MSDCDVKSVSAEPVRLIHDLTELRRFEHMVVQPTLKAVNNDMAAARPAMVISLFCRSKYESEEAKKNKALHAVLDDELYTPHSQLDNMISRWEQPRPFTYKSSADVEPRQVPNTTLVVYMHMNPRDQLSALVALQNHVMQAVLTNDRGGRAKIPERLNHALVKQVQQGNRVHHWVEIDADTKDTAKLREFITAAQTHTPDVLDRVSFTVETRGGYHIVFAKEQFPTDMYKTCHLPQFNYDEAARDGKLCHKKYFEIRGDVCVPVPGTLQGGFPVRVVDVHTLI